MLRRELDRGREIGIHDRPCNGREYRRLCPGSSRSSKFATARSSEAAQSYSPPKDEVLRYATASLRLIDAAAEN